MVGRTRVHLVPLVLSCQQSENVIPSMVLLAMVLAGTVLKTSTTSLLTLKHWRNIDELRISKP